MRLCGVEPLRQTYRNVKVLKNGHRSGLTEFSSDGNHLLMTTTAKVFASGRSQAIRLPQEFRVSGKEVRLSRVSGGILISEGDPLDAFEEGCRSLGDEFFESLDRRDRKTPQVRDFNAGLS